MIQVKFTLFVNLGWENTVLRCKIHQDLILYFLKVYFLKTKWIKKKAADESGQIPSHCWIHKSVQVQ